MTGYLTFRRRADGQTIVELMIPATGEVLWSGETNGGLLKDGVIGVRFEVKAMGWRDTPEAH